MTLLHPRLRLLLLSRLGDCCPLHPASSQPPSREARALPPRTQPLLLSTWRSQQLPRLQRPQARPRHRQCWRPLLPRRQLHLQLLLLGRLQGAGEGEVVEVVDLAAEEEQEEAQQQFEQSEEDCLVTRVTQVQQPGVAGASDSSTVRVKRERQG